MSRTLIVALCAALLAVLGLGSSTALATKYWKNTVVTGNWGTGANWSAVSAAGARTPIGTATAPRPQSA